MPKLDLQEMKKQIRIIKGDVTKWDGEIICTSTNPTINQHHRIESW
jgi:hypothetical protein